MYKVFSTKSLGRYLSNIITFNVGVDRTKVYYLLWVY